MARKPSGPSPSGRAKAAPGSARESPTENSPPDERYGPVALTRHVKDDGRALIVYRRAGHRQP